MDAARLIAHLADVPARAYLRYLPIALGKRLLWQRLVEPYLAWRPAQATARTVDGVRLALVLPDLIQSYLYYFGVWEPNLTAFFRRTLRPGDTVVDVGANIGYFSLLAARLVGPSGAVHAVEASPAIADLLERNVALNGFANVTVHRVAASDRAGKLHLFSGGAGGNLGASTTRDHRAAEAGYALEAEVPARPLSEIVPLDALLAARIVKIDVEGAEADVLAGLASVMDRFGPDTVFVVELTLAELGEGAAGLEAIVDRFARCGFEAWHLPNDYSPRAYMDRRPPAEPVRGIAFGRSQADAIFRRADAGTD
ncbi:MAG: FkbM family methyltransferase [Alphaproteobacteria bacterium]|nr:FkbM family methyltransferase [Alphaproteobacteria bacterium]